MCGLLRTPYFASGAALGTTKETSDRYRPLPRTDCEKFARGRCISADLRNTQELKGIRAEKPLRERGVIILFAEAGWGLFDRILPAGTAWSTHYIVSPIINVSGSTATGDWYFLIQMVPKSPAHAPVVAVYGSYQDTYEKVGGDWKIKQTLTSYAFPPT